MSPVRVALVGMGWAGAMHAKAYDRVYGVELERRTLCALDENLPAFAKAHGFQGYTDSFEAVLTDKAVDVVDIVTPPALHLDMIRRALHAGKDVICEKPVIGYFGKPGDPEPVGGVDKRRMLACVAEELNSLQDELRASGKRLFYAENWIYAPAFMRACELVEKKGTRLLEIRGLTGHKGSHAPHAARWDQNGGGALIRQGTHPIAAALHAKRREMEARGEAFAVRSVLCDTAAMTKEIPDRGAYLATRPMDVEDWAHAVITFSDGTKATVTAGDIYLGEILNSLELYGTDAVFSCNLTPNNLLEAYFSDERGVERQAVMEKSDHNLGRVRALVSDEYLRGYYGEIQDFMECMASGRAPLSGFAAAKETLLCVYAAYCSAQSGAPVSMRDWL